MITYPRLNCRVQIQHQVTQINDLGEPSNDWVTLHTVWAQVRPLSGREFWAAQQVAAETSHEIKIRYLPGLAPDMRVLYGERVFQVESAVNLAERGRWAILRCRELNPTTDRAG